MSARSDRKQRRTEWAIGAYSSSPGSVEELGPAPADWFGRSWQPATPVDGEGRIAVRRLSTLSAGTGFAEPGLDGIRQAQARAVAELRSAQPELERFSAQARLKAEALRRLLGFHSGQELTFVVPTLEATDPIHRTVIASEDVRAFNRMRLDLGTTGLESSVTVLMGADDEVSPDPRDLMFFCRDERNPMTREFLRLQPVGFDFVHDGSRADGRAKWAIRQDGAEILRSESYDSEAALESHLDAPGDTRHAVLRCPAIVVRAPNPFNPERSHAVLIAGVRAFGTWGAAEFLCSEAETLLEQTQGGDFVALIEVEADATVRRCADFEGSPRFSTVFERVCGWNRLDLLLLSAADDRRHTN